MLCPSPAALASQPAVCTLPFWAPALHRQGGLQGPAQPRVGATVGPSRHARGPWLAWLRPEMDSPHPTCGWVGSWAPGLAPSWHVHLTGKKPKKQENPASTQDVDPWPGTQGGTCRPSSPAGCTQHVPKWGQGALDPKPHSPWGGSPPGTPLLAQNCLSAQPGANPTLGLHQKWSPGPCSHQKHILEPEWWAPLHENTTRRPTAHFGTLGHT